MNQDFEKDIEIAVTADFIDWKRFENKSIFVTGATGLIGFSLILVLLKANKFHNLNLKIFALARNLERAKERFENVKNEFDLSLNFVISNVEDSKITDLLKTAKIDFIVHGASQTGSKEFVNHPVETILTALDGTKNILNLAREKNVSGFVYLSSMEVYGYPKKCTKVAENQIGTFSPLDARNSYPLSKVQCENLCFSYAKEYELPTRILRLTQTFGPGVNYDDNRVFAYFARCVKEKTDIVLKTKGETERCYLYTTDAATAILSVLINGENGKAYNAGDEITYCSISQMAENIAKDAGINVVYGIQDNAKNGFPQTLYMDLDTTELKNLGWKILYKSVGGGITEMINSIVEWWKR